MNIVPQQADFNNKKPAPSSQQRKSIAIIGSGISGTSAAWALNPFHNVTLFEAEARAGGHTATVDIDYDGTPISVDTGFIVYNEHNYPLLTELFDKLDIHTIGSNMSFALSLDHGALEWSGDSMNTIFGQRSNLASPKFYWMLREILRFNSQCLKDRAKGVLDTITIGDYLAMRKYSRGFRDNYLIPMAAAIWSTPRVQMMDFPARTFVDFFDNHRLINAVRPEWRTVKGGSRNYHKVLLTALAGRVRLSTPIKAVTRDSNGVTLRTAHGETLRFDEVIFATHSDQAASILADASEAEANILNNVKYCQNHTVLHRDPRLMPNRKRVWASWNYRRQSNGGEENGIALSYWMNRLQSIPDYMPLFVSLNPDITPREELTFGEWHYSHPLFDQAAIAAQKRLPSVQAINHTQFVGAWTGYGFHEDGLRSGLEAAQRIDERATIGSAAAHNAAIFSQTAE